MVDAALPLDAEQRVTARTTLIVVTGAPELGDTVERLRREVVHVNVAESDRLTLPTPPQTASVVMWIPAGLPADAFRSAITWAQSRKPRAALIACAPEGSSADAEAALEAGFDDFVARACSARELAGRLRALHRRLDAPTMARTPVIRQGTITLNTLTHELWVGRRRVTLSSAEASVLRTLIGAPGKTFTREQILDSAWGDASLDVTVRAVDNVVLRIRRKLNIANEGDAAVKIVTVRGVGFRLAVG